MCALSESTKISSVLLIFSWRRSAFLNYYGENILMKVKSKLSKIPVCMIAYANYFTDARIKNYVQTLLEQGCEVDVFALGQDEPCPSGLRVFCLAKKVESQRALPYVISQIWFFMLAFIYVGKSYFERRYKLVHVHNMPDFIVFSAFIPKLFGARVILDVHDTMPEAYATKIDLPLTHPLIGLIRFEERISAAFVDRVITTNDLHLEALVEHGIPSGKISVILNTGNEAVFCPRPHTHLPVDGLTLAYHGTIAARLGLDLILDAIRQALPSCPNLRFILIGDGEFMPVVRKLIKDYKLDHVVQHVGWVSVEDLPFHLSTADIGVVGIRGQYEIRRNWGLPVKMLEYAAMEIPVIAPRLRVIRHYFDEDSAFYYKTDDVEDFSRRIIEIYNDPDKINEVKKNLQIFNKKYNWTAMERTYLNIMTDLSVFE